MRTSSSILSHGAEEHSTRAWGAGTRIQAQCVDRGGGVDVRHQRSDRNRVRSGAYSGGQQKDGEPVPGSMHHLSLITSKGRVAAAHCATVLQRAWWVLYRSQKHATQAADGAG